MRLVSLIDELNWRGLIHDISDRQGLSELSEQDAFYVGYDPSAPSLQLGNLVPIVTSLRLAKAGLRAIQLFGGATGLIGDPSGKSQERPFLEAEEIRQNSQAHMQCVSRIFERAGVRAQFLNNLDWSKDLGLLEFLRDVGKHFTVNYMIAKDVVKARLEGEGISFTEFSYMLLQAHDFYYLFQNHSCKLQIGGSDQWGNITAGLELIRRKGLSGAYAFSIPLILDQQGRKFGKSEAGSLWLDAGMTSSYNFHQFWLNTDDKDVLRYLKIFTFLDAEEIEALAVETAKAPEKRSAQEALADSMCDLVHGKQATQEAKRSAAVLFGGSMEGISKEQLLEIFSDVPSSSIPRDKLSQLDILDLLVLTQLVKSKGEARRLIASGGAYANNNRIQEVDFSFDSDFCNQAEIVILRSGKKNYHLLKLLG